MHRRITKAKPAHSPARCASNQETSLTNRDINKALNKILLLSRMTIVFSCNGQERTNTRNHLNTSNSGPTVIKNLVLHCPASTQLQSANISEVFFKTRKGIYGLAHKKMEQCGMTKKHLLIFPQPRFVAQETK